MNSKSKAWTIAFIVVISGSRIGMGFYSSLSGPTLLYLARNVSVSVTAISTVFTARSVGILLGGVLGGVIKRFAGPNFRHLLTLGIGVGVLGLMDLVVPWITEFWLLVIVIIVGGIMYGYLDAGLQALLLQLWGEKASRPHIQLFHFMFSVGAFIAPLVAAPFLTMANSGDSAEDRCQSSNSETKTTTLVTPTISHNQTTDDSVKFDFNPTGWAYVIAAGWLVTVSCVMILLALLNVENKVAMAMEKSSSSSENRLDEPFRDVVWLFLLVVGFYFCCVTVGNVFFNFIYSVTLCSGLQFTPAQASTINSVFWAGVGLGRLSGVGVSKVLKPRTILIICIVGSIADMTLMCIWGETTVWIAWGVAAVHGYTTSVLYPTGVSWISQYTSVSGTYMFVFNIGNACGSLSMLPLAGYLFELNPFNVMYLVLSLAIGDAVMFALALYAAKKHKVFLRRKPKLDEVKESNAFENGGFVQIKL